jgi:ATP-dependent DNA helicase DinG
MRQRALESDLVVVNHALFFANLALEADEIGKILPDFSVLILDEAHEVEDIAADHFGKKLTNYQVEDFCRRLRKAFPEPSGMTPLITKLEASSRTFFDTFPGGEGRHSLSHFAGGVAPSTDLRVELGNYQDELVSSLLAIYHHLEGDRSGPEETDAFVKRADSYLTSLEELFSMDNPENVYWYEKSGRGVLVHVAPIKVSNLLREKLFGRADTVILASATLTAAGDFGYLKERLGVTESEDVIVQGEFDYSSQTALYIPKNAPQPGGNGAFEYLFEEILRLLDITSGHAFLLFTSVKQMVRVYRALEREVEYPVFCQGEKPKSQLLEEFKLTSGAVLCATSSFWQGVDVQGDALRAVVIDKLPFHVPTEPLVAARLNSLQNEGKNPFLEYSVPEAIINLRQGLGRLIRSRSDTGILAILDSRLWKKTYGKHFLNSLPNCLVTDNMEKLENFFRRSVSKNTEG